MSSMYIRWLIFSCDLLSLYPAVHFLSKWFSGIMGITYSKGERASPWKIPLWIFASAKLLPPAVNSTLQVFLVFSRKFITWDIGPAVRVFANGPGDLGSIPGRVIPKTLKMELDTTLLNTQHYKVRFKGKVEQSWEWSSALPNTLV